MLTLTTAGIYAQLAQSAPERTAANRRVLAAYNDAPPYSVAELRRTPTTFGDSRRLVAAMFEGMLAPRRLSRKRRRHALRQLRKSFDLAAEFYCDRIRAELDRVLYGYAIDKIVQTV